MIIRAIDAGGDWQFGNGFASYATGEQAVEENIKTRLLSWRNNCFFALQDCVDWSALLDIGQQKNLEAAVRSVILQSYGVVGINSATVVLERATRAITITANIRTIYSPSFELSIQQAAGAPNA